MQKFTSLLVGAALLFAVVGITRAAVVPQPTKKPADVYDQILALNTVDVEVTLSDPFVEFCADLEAGDDLFVPATFKGIRQKAAGGNALGTYDGETVSLFASFRDDGTELFTADEGPTPIVCAANCEFSLGAGTVPVALFSAQASSGGGSPTVRVCVTLDIGRN